MCNYKLVPVSAGEEAVRAVKHTTTLTASALDAIWGSFLHHPSNVLNQYHLSCVTDKCCNRVETHGFFDTLLVFLEIYSTASNTEKQNSVQLFIHSQQSQ